MALSLIAQDAYIPAVTNNKTPDAHAIKEQLTHNNSKRHHYLFDKCKRGIVNVQNRKRNFAHAFVHGPRQNRIEFVCE